MADGPISALDAVSPKRGATGAPVVIDPPELPGELSDFLKTALAKQPPLAVSAAIVTPAGVRTAYYGQVERRGRLVPNDARTIFEIGSITKSFTGSLLAILTAEGRVSLSDPANQHLPKDLQLPSSDAGTIRLQHLVSHSSGLPAIPPSMLARMLATGSIENPYASLDRPALAAGLKELTLETPVGEKYAYSNLGMGLLGAALVARTKSPSYEALLRARILNPLQLHDTGIELNPKQQAWLAQPHLANDPPTPPWRFATLEGCGAVRSTLGDLVRWMQAHLGQLDTPIASALRRSHERQFPQDMTSDDRGPIVAYGWHLVRLPNRAEPVVFHNGATGGSRSFMAFDPRVGAGVVLLCNSADSLDGVGFRMVSALLDRLAPAVSKKPRE